MTALEREMFNVLGDIRAAAGNARIYLQASDRLMSLKWLRVFSKRAGQAGMKIKAYRDYMRKGG